MTVNKARMSPISKRMLDTDIASYHRLNNFAMQKRLKVRKLDDEEINKGLIANKVPAKRDGASLEYIRREDGKNALVLVGGDTFQRALNDIHIIKY